MGCLEFFMRYRGFWYNKTYEYSCVYNQNENQVNNKMHIGEWWQKQPKKHPFQATIILLLILNDKTVMSFNHSNQTLWLVYITIEDLDAKS